MPALSLGARLAFTFGAIEAQQLSSAYIDLEHLFLGACKAASIPDDADDMIEGIERDQFAVLKAECTSFAATLSAGGLEATPARRRLRALCRDADPGPHQFTGRRSPRCRRVFVQADGLATHEVDLSVLMHAMLANTSGPIEQLLAELHVSRDQLFGALRGATMRMTPKQNDGTPVAAEAPSVRMPRGDAPQGFAERFGRDLTALGRAGKLIRAVGREDETRRLARVLMQAKKNNPLLVGEPGVGKTAIVEGLALQIGEPTAAPALSRLRLVEVSLGALVAGTKYRGEFEERVQRLITESEADPNLVLFIDELHLLLGAGAAGSGGMDAADLLKPALARGKMRVIGATTTEEYRKTVESDAALERRFEVVWVEEPSRETAIRILEAVRPSLEEHHGVMIASQALVRAVDLSIRYLPDRRLPDKALDVLDQACARAMLSTLTPRSARSAVTAAVRAEIGVDDVAAAISERCRIPVERLTQDEGQRLLAMEEILSQRVLGQRVAVTAVAETIRTARAGLKDPRRPLGVFLFLGATGTGKTELAKALAEFLFGSERRLIRIDMSEYAEKHAVARLIGAPPGYIGHDEGGQLTDRVRNDPYSVVLFDEIEKAHPDTFDLFLQMFDEGQLTDSRGRQASFRECVIIMTSNLGASAEPERRPMGFAAAGSPPADPAQADFERRHREAAARALRPELLNRIQHIVVFQPLGRAALPGIIDKVLRRMRAQVSERGIEVQLSPEAYEFLADAGYSDEFGAREMERAIERLVIQPLGRAMLEGLVHDDTTVQVQVVDGKLALQTSDELSK